MTAVRAGVDVLPVTQWIGGLTTVRAELLDCIQANLAVLADHHHGAGSHVGLGAGLRFRPRPGACGLPTVEPAVEPQVTEGGEWVGLAVEARWHGVNSDQLRELAQSHHGQLYVVADAYDMPWLPYWRQRRMEHSFLVEDTGGRARVTDAYLNQTAWGLASPGCWEYPWDALPAAALAVSWRPGEGGAPDVVPTIELDQPSCYVAAYAECPDRRWALERLTVETWLLTRSRKLHASYRDRLNEEARPAVPPLTAAHSTSTSEVTEHLRRWDQLAGQAFLALRRVERGRPEPGRLLPDLADLLAADVRVFAVHTPKPAR